MKQLTEADSQLKTPSCSSDVQDSDESESSVEDSVVEAMPEVGFEVVIAVH